MQVVIMKMQVDYFPNKMVKKLNVDNTKCK